MTTNSRVIKAIENVLYRTTSDVDYLLVKKLIEELTYEFETLEEKQQKEVVKVYE